MRDRGDYDLYYNNHEHVKGVKKMDIGRFDNFFKRIDKKHPGEYKYINDNWGEKYKIVTFVKPKENDPDILFLFTGTTKEDERDRCTLVTKGTVFSPEPMTEAEMKECVVHIEDTYSGQYCCHLLSDGAHVFVCNCNGSIMFKQNGALLLVYSTLAAKEIMNSPKIRIPGIERFRKLIRNFPTRVDDFYDIDKVYEYENTRVIEHKTSGDAGQRYKIFSVYTLCDSIDPDKLPSAVLRYNRSAADSFDQIKREFSLPMDGWEEYSVRDLVPLNHDVFPSIMDGYSVEDLGLDPVNDKYAIEALESGKIVANKVKTAFNDAVYVFPLGAVYDADWWYKLISSNDEEDQDRVNNILDVIDMINLSGRDYMNKVIKRISALGAMELRNFLHWHRVDCLRGVYDSLE